MKLMAFRKHMLVALCLMYLVLDLFKQLLDGNSIWIQRFKEETECLFPVSYSQIR